MTPEQVTPDHVAAVHAGTLYGVGMGPGDPELVTVKAAPLLNRMATDATLGCDSDMVLMNNSVYR